MSQNNDEPIQLTDDDEVGTEDDLLANAIPIDESDEEESGEPKAFSADDAEQWTSADAADLKPLDLIADEEAPAERHEIRHKDTGKRHEDNWDRTPNSTGTGAIHVKTFVCKLRADSIENMDQNINEWLDAHPQYEVKFVTANVGPLVGKTKEDAMFVNVWV